VIRSLLYFVLRSILGLAYSDHHSAAEAELENAILVTRSQSFAGG
jgi:hypothetical protein